ncbi:MAG: Stk1 family PASTA domain-containing Ser/Thr kinase [Eubacteriales bacterium]|nr:Stk1 family PASTA domain-containing Ser/Thr kinase [Eubacteriales bacterium]
MIKIGMLIADRYEVLEKVGTGGMSFVYKAKDHRLNRMVAVKVLKQEFAENATFVSKFRVEAQAAAGLMHPNIVNVYDVGEEKGTHYIIMEYVNGITLKQYIEKKERLSPREAVTVAIQVAMGLAAAHRGHIIHRDIKPQNIIVSKEGKVKVTDFGIAKASTSNTITSNVMGSVHYTSPEQARGGYSDEKSDIYSLGVTLYEMLTGRVPYEGDTTVAVALQHIQEPFPSPRDLVPDVPVSVEQIVLKCCEKSPDMRYQTMDELAADLRRSLNEPEGVVVKRKEEDLLSETRSMSKKDREEIRRRSSTAGTESQVSPAQESAMGAAALPPDAGVSGKGGRTENGTALTQAGGASFAVPRGGDAEPPGAGQAVLRDPEESYLDEDDDIESGENGLEEDERRMDILIRILSVLAVLVVGSVILLVAVNRRTGAGTNLPFQGGKKASEQSVADGAEQTDGQEQTDENDNQTDSQMSSAPNVTTVTMPRVVGSRLADARAAIENAGLAWEIVYAPSEVYEEGIVIDAGAAEGTQLEKGTRVRLTVSRIETVSVPSLTGKTQADAERELTSLGLVPAASQEYSDEIESGCVISQDPQENTTVPTGTEVTILISMGRDLTGMVKVPNLLGLTEEEAFAALLRAGLTPGESTVTDTSGRYSPGTVIGQSIGKDEYVEEMTQVDLDVSGTLLYSYSARIEAPSRFEDPDFVDGTLVTLAIETDDGDVIWNKTTTEFPCSVSVTGITCPGGTLYLTYTNLVWEDAQTGDTEGTEYSVESEREYTMEIVRELTFIRE